MYWLWAIAFMVTLRGSATKETIFGTAKLEHHWDEAFKVMIHVQIPYPVSDGWRTALLFSQPIKKIDVWRAKVIAISADRKTYALKNMYFNEVVVKGKNLTMAVLAYKVRKTAKPGNVTVLFRSGNVIPSFPTLLPPTTAPEPQIPIYQLMPVDESDSGFKMVLKYQVPVDVKDWSISLKFTKNISTQHLSIDKGQVAFQKKTATDSLCVGPRLYSIFLKAKSVLRLEFSVYKAKLYGAAPNGYYVFHGNSSKCEDFELPTASPGTAVPQERAVAELTQQWPPNNFKMRFDLQVINSVRGGWKITLKFSEPVARISNLNGAKLNGKSQDQRAVYIGNIPGRMQNANLRQCERIKIEFSGELVHGAAGLNSLSTVAMFETKEPEYAEINPPGMCPTVPPSKK